MSPASAWAQGVQAAPSAARTAQTATATVTAASSTDRVSCQRNLSTPPGACFGEISFSNGNRYRGPIVGQRPAGRGELSFPNGRRYTGDFIDGQATGQGSMNLPDGAVYVGEFVGGRYNGQGILTLPTGSRYMGNFVASVRKGKGKLFDARGQLVEEGLYEDGRLVRALNND
jgi:hypothetical protein